MKAFDFNRFMNVARWDLTVNGKFYTRSALLMVALICMPVVLYYLYNMLTDSSFYATETADDVFFFCVLCAKHPRTYFCLVISDLFGT